MTELTDQRLRTRRMAWRLRRRGVLLASTAGVILLSATACGSSGSGSARSTSTGNAARSSADSGVAYARQQVAKYEKAVTIYPSPGPALDPQKVAALRGKTVLFVPLGLVGPFVLAQQSVQAALSHVGITVKTCDPNFLPPQVAACFNQARTDGAVAVITSGISNSLAANAYTALKSQSIPVLAAAAGAGNPTNTAELAFQSEVPSTQLAGTLSADQVIADSNGKADVLFVASTGSPGVEAQGAQTKTELTTKCPHCKLTSIAFDGADTSHIASGVSSALISNPNTHYILVQADANLAYVLPGIQTSGFANKVKIVAGSGTPAVVLMMQQKLHNIIGDAAFDAAYIGWNAADGVLRLLTGQRVPSAPYFPVRLFTPDNLQGQHLSASMDVSPLYGPASFQQMFYDLWAGKRS